MNQKPEYAVRHEQGPFSHPQIYQYAVYRIDDRRSVRAFRYRNERERADAMRLASAMRDDLNAGRP